MTYYVIYKGDWPVMVGTLKECAERLGVSEKTVQWYATPQCREKERRGKRARMLAERVEV